VEVVLGAEVSGRLYACSSLPGGALRNQRITLREAHRRITAPAKVELFYVLSGTAQILVDESEISADEGNFSSLNRCLDHACSTPTAPIYSARLRTGRDFSLPSGEAGQHFSLLALGYLELIKGEAQLRSDFVEHGGWDLQVEMCIAQLSAGVLEWSSR
jgi:hypothetical protein